MLKQYLENNILITDGAMGTYYSEITGDSISYCEYANIEKPEIIEKIHKEYIKAGAKLIRTNTFSANCVALDVEREKVRAVLINGYKIAEAAAKGSNVFIGCSIGPIRESRNSDEAIDILKEYKFIVDTLIEAGAEIFIFETFSSLDYLKEVSEYIKAKKEDSFILTQFAIIPDGFTRDGISVSRIIKEIKEINSIDAYGFNCGSGPTHLYNALASIKIDNDIVSVLPNAGYPELVNERTVYVNNPDYFAEKILKFRSLGAKIIGGCCGTTPEHIRRIKEELDKGKVEVHVIENKVIEIVENNNKITNSFSDKLRNNEFVLAVELSPPFDISVEKIMQGARICKDNGIDLITVPDSPMGKVRVDSSMIASKIKRDIGIDAMPHICCRDKNVNALRAGLMGSHIEGIRNVLSITGDPVPEADRLNTKNVFNLNSYKLIELIAEMNKEIFGEDNINIGAALNLNVRNKEVELSRMIKKLEKGANFFLTQPIYDEATIEFLIKLKKEYNVKILGGVFPIVSYRNAQFLNNELSGINIPQHYIDRFHPEMPKEEAEEIGVNIAVELANKIKEHVDGLYLLTPFKRVEMVMKVLNRIK